MLLRFLLTTKVPSQGCQATDEGHRCRCQNRWISGRGSRTVRLGSMVIGDKGHDVYPGSGPLYGGNTLLPACNAPRPMCQVSSSYSLLLRCHLLACCILSCHHPHCIFMFSKLASVPASSFRPLSVLSPTTLARAHGTSEILFYKWPRNVLGLG